MFERQLMIAGLQKQYDLLASLIEEIENKPTLRIEDVDFCQARTRRIANNLRRLRKIKSNYFDISLS